MTILNGYCTIGSFKQTATVNDSVDDVDIEQCIETAARQIDAHCARRFWQDTDVVERVYYPSEATRAWVNDISTTTGLVVKVDANDDGTHETTLTLGTDFVLEPANADKEFPVRPWESIRLLSSGQLTMWPSSSGRPVLSVTAKFGWPAVPDPVERVNLVQTRNVWKASDASNDGVIAVSMEGVAIRPAAMSALSRMSLEPFVRFTQVDNAVD